VPAAGAPTLTYDAAADVLGAWLAPDDGTAVTRELAPGVHADVDAAGRLVSVEVLDASRHYPRAALEGLAGPDTYLTLAEAAAASEGEVTAATLRVQLARGRLPGIKRGRDWLVTPAALWTYLDSRAPSGRRARPPRARPGAPRRRGAERAERA